VTGQLEIRSAEIAAMNTPERDPTLDDLEPELEDELEPVE